MASLRPLGRFRQIVDALLGISAYTKAPPESGPSLDSESVETIRESMGGQLSPPPITQTRWYRSDLETSIFLADGGDLSMAARLWRSVQTDGVVRGVMGTLTGGITRLKKKFRGKDELVQELQVGFGSVRSTFDEMCPPAELARLAADGKALGVSVGELVPVPGRGFPVLVTLDPECLFFRWSENRWYYRSIAANIPITPGDGRWVLHIPGGRVSPWQQGIWQALGKAYVRKIHADLHKDNWEAKLANPARVAVSPQGASDTQKQAWFQQVMAWGVNTVFGMTPGYDAKLLESNGRGHESFESSMDRSDRESIIAIAGQIVTTEGGTGFVNGDLYKSIRADVIQEVAESLAYTVNTQILPSFIAARYGLDALAEGGAVFEYNIDPPKELAQTAAAMTATGAAIKVLDESLQAHDLQANAQEILERAGIPTLPGKADLPVAAPGEGGVSAESLASGAESGAVAEQTKAPKIDTDLDDEEAA